MSLSKRLDVHESQYALAFEELEGWDITWCAAMSASISVWYHLKMQPTMRVKIFIGDAIQRHRKLYPGSKSRRNNDQVQRH